MSLFLNFPLPAQQLWAATRTYMRTGYIVFLPSLQDGEMKIIIP